MGQEVQGATPLLVECPSCGQPGFMDTWQRFESSDTAVVDLLCKGKLFKYQCPVCGTETTIVYDCLFRDREHRILFMFSPLCNDAQEQEKKIGALFEQGIGFGGDLSTYQRRIVSTAFEFCEKARILAAGYDDRAIELLKVAIKRGMLQEGIIGARDTLIYERTMPDGGISFVVTGEIPGDVVGVPQGYDFVKKHLEEHSDEVMGEYRFDAAWANRFLP